MNPQVEQLAEVVVTEDVAKKSAGASVAAERSSEPQQELQVAASSDAVPADGWNAYNQYLSSSLNYPVAADTSGISGNVILRLTVSSGGDISNVTVLKGLGYGCDEEAIRLVENGPAFNAAVDAGQPVTSDTEVTVTFNKN